MIKSLIKLSLHFIAFVMKGILLVEAVALISYELKVNIVYKKTSSVILRILMQGTTTSTFVANLINYL